MFPDFVEIQNLGVLDGSDRHALKIKEFPYLIAVDKKFPF
jgi:hypothetical protein